MQSLGLNNEEIKPFANAEYWLKFFPPLAKRDLMKLGLHVSSFTFSVLIIMDCIGIFLRLIGDGRSLQQTQIRFMIALFVGSFCV